MFSVGQRLQKARLEQGLDLAAVAARTRIQGKYLAAIEADDRSSLPSGFFFKSFVNQYARVVSLDTTEIDAEIDRLLKTEAPLLLPGQDGMPIRRAEPLYPTRRYARRKMYASAAALLLVMLSCSGVYAWWHTHPSMLEALKKLTDRNPSRETAAAPATVPAVSVAMAATIQPPAQSIPVPANKVLLDLTAREKTWVSISSEGKVVFAGLLGANETKTVEGKEGAKMKVGNAAGIDVRLNGKLLGPLGARGQVLVVVFTQDSFQVVPPPKETD